MSKYTTEVRYICEMKSGYNCDELKSHTVDDIINNSRHLIFNFEYPIFDSSYKPTLENKILKHYYTREISAETFGLWQLWLNARMNEIMPKYNKLYKAERDILGKELKNIDVKINSLRTDDLLKESNYLRTDKLKETRDLTRTDNLHETSDSTRTDNLTRTNSHNDTDKKRFSDTPQGSMQFADVDNGNVWLTTYERNDNTGGYTNNDSGTVRNAGSINNTGTVKNGGTIDNTGTQANDGTEANTGTQNNDTTESGYRGQKIYAELISAYADKVLNIDVMIINDLSNLFFGLW